MGNLINRSNNSMEESLKNENIELKKQIESLKNVNNILEKKLMGFNKKNNDNNNNEDNIIIIKGIKFEELINDQRIDILIENLLSDPNINIKYLPDFVEKQIYRNALSLFIKIVDHTLKTSSMNVLGNKIMFDNESNQKSPIMDQTHNSNDQ